VIVPTLAPQVTDKLKFPVPWTAAVHWLVWPDWMVAGKQDALTDMIVEAAVTVTVAEPDLVTSCTEVAVIVTGPAVVGAVKRPVDEIVPPDVAQVTEVL
jgi:hypothetical protein